MGRNILWKPCRILDCEIGHLEGAKQKEVTSRLGRPDAGVSPLSVGYNLCTFPAGFMVNKAAMQYALKNFSLILSV